MLSDVVYSGCSAGIARLAIGVCCCCVRSDCALYVLGYLAETVCVTEGAETVCIVRVRTRLCLQGMQLVLACCTLSPSFAEVLGGFFGSIRRPPCELCVSVVPSGRPTLILCRWTFLWLSIFQYLVVFLVLGRGLGCIHQLEIRFKFRLRLKHL